MIEGFGIDYPLNPCKCGESKAPGFWFKMDETWVVRCVASLCDQRFRNDFVKPKKDAQENWNLDNPKE